MIYCAICYTIIDIDKISKIYYHIYKKFWKEVKINEQNAIRNKRKDTGYLP